MLPLLIDYSAWHYSRALTDYARVWSNVLWFLFNFFSIPLLLRTLFAPFHRLDEGYKKGFYPSEWATTFGVNMLMRFVGALLRLTLIAMGCLSLGLALIIGAGIFFVWLLAPVFLVFLVGLGLTYVVV